MIIEKWFPQTIAYTFYDGDKSYIKKLQDKCFEIQSKVEKGGEFWQSDVYNTINKYDLNTDNDFKELNKWVDERVKDYTNELQFLFGDLSKEQSWFNIYKRGDYQEYHHHAMNMVSAIFILKAGDENTTVSFDNPHTDMIYADGPTQVSYKSEDCKLIIFRSHLKHAVTMHNSDEPRISIAYNYRRIIT